MNAGVDDGQDSLPPTPKFDGVTLGFGRVVVIEWLGPGDKKTGKELVEWMERKGFHTARPGRLIELYQPETAGDFMAILEKVAEETRCGGKLPLIHIEAHGNTESEAIGYWHGDADGVESILTWEDLTQPLREINIASRCNLLLVSAACWGHAAILASCQTERVPFIACVGFGSEVDERSVLEAMKAFYVALFDGRGGHLEDAVEAAKRELLEDEDIAFDLMHVMSYQTVAEDLRGWLTPDAMRTRALNMVTRQLEGRIPLLDTLPYSQARTQLHTEQAQGMQMIWDRRFMLDLFPENRARFGVDIASLITALLDREYRSAGRSSAASTSAPGY